MKIKKIVASALLLCMIASLSACGEKENTTSNTTSNNISQSSTSSTNIINPEYHNNIYSDIKYESSNKNNDYEYIEYVDHVQITKYLGSQTDVTIPSKINDKPVTCIGGDVDTSALGEDPSLFGENINKVTIPDTVTTIGEYAFGNCPNLSNITIPDSVINIYYRNSWTPFKNTKWYDNQPNGIVYAGKIALDYKADNNETTKNTNITIKDDTIGIAPYAFYNQENISSITIPNSVKSIGECAFKDCKNLSNISIPDSVINIGDCAFGGTKWFENQNDGIVYAGKVAYEYKGIIDETEKLIFKNDTVGIADHSFNNALYLAEVIIPNNVEYIGDYAFYNSEIKSLSIGNNVKIIGDHAFAGCYLANVTIPDKVITIGKSAFSDCAFTNITIPNNVEIIESSAFNGCIKLRTINIGNSVISIGEDAFRGCENLKEVKLGNNIKYIGPQAFFNCSKIENIVLPDSITYIGDSAFEYLYSDYEIGTIPTQGKASSLIQ